jgi:hypothetical protein
MRLNNFGADALTVNGRLLLRNGTTDPNNGGGVWLTKPDNSALLGFMGTQNAQNIGFYGGPTGWGLTYNSLNSYVGIGNNNPLRPLSFPATLEKKISLYPGATGDVGFGVFGNELRIHSDNANAKVSFGYDSYVNGFTELAKVEKNGVYAMSIFGSLWVNGVTYSSDERFKKNISTISSPLKKLMQINGVEYEMNAASFPKNNFTTGRQIGLLAQNVEKIIPEAVTENNGYKGVDYARLVPLLIESIKEQQKQIDELKKIVEQFVKK